MLERFAGVETVDMNTNLRDGGESADATIKNLGAFVRSGSSENSEQTANGTRYYGEGCLPR